MTKLKQFFTNLKNEELNIKLLILFAFISGFFLGSGIMTDYDVWFHYRAGEYFMLNGEVPKVAIGSWYGINSGLQWISHEWLFGVIIYWIIETFGIVGVSFFVPMMIGTVVATMTFLFRDVFKENYLLGFIGILLVSFILSMGKSPRPHLIAYLLTVILFYIMRKDSEEDSKILYTLPILTILWVNFHGGSYIMIHIFLLINTIIHLFDFRLGKIVFEKQDWKRTKRRLLIMLLCICVIPLNGHGFDMVLYPFTNFQDALMQSTISEWASPDLKLSPHYKIYLMMALGIWAMIATRKDIKAVDFCTYFIYLVLTSRSSRFAAQLCVVGIPIMLHYTDSIDGWFRLTKDKLITILLTSVGSMFLIMSIVCFVDAIKQPFTSWSLPSEDVVEVMHETNPERLLNDYNIGGFLLYEHIDVFIDGRADIYTKYNYSDYLEMSNFKGKAVELLDEYDFDYILIKKVRPLNTYLEVCDDYEKLAEDDNHAYYKVLK